MPKANITVEGTVQGTGYRALVKNYANRRGITGHVRNLPDGKVEIFCEGTKDKIEQLTKDINVKGSPLNPLGLNVEKIGIVWEGEKKFKEARKAYTGFEIDYGAEKLTAFEKENLESLEWAKLRFTMLETGISFFREESNQNFKALENGIYSFQDQTNNNFNVMAEKYGDISKGVNATKEQLMATNDGIKSSKEELKTSLDNLPDKIGDALTKHMKNLMEKP